MTFAKVKRFITRNWLVIILAFFLGVFVYLLSHIGRRKAESEINGSNTDIEPYDSTDTFWTFYGKTVGNVLKTFWNIISSPFTT